MMSRDRKTRPAMTNGWLADNIASNLRNNAGLSSSEAAPPTPPSFFPLGALASRRQVVATRQADETSALPELQINPGL
jgi:hypothetical protein